MIPAQYRPRHQPDCSCAVCWANAFHHEMTQRNESRAERCRQLLANPRLALQHQDSFFTVFDEVAQ